MTDKRISELAVAANSTLDDIHPIVQGGVTLQITNLLANYTLVNASRTQITAMAVKLGNAGGRVAISGIEFWNNSVKQATPDATYLMYKDVGNSFSGSDPLDTNLTGSLANLHDDDPATCIKYDCTFVNELSNPDRENLYLYFQWNTAMPFFDEIRIIAASGGDYDVDEIPERIAYYMDADLSLEALVTQFYVGDPDDALTWTDGEEKSFTVPNFYMPTILSNDGIFVDTYNVTGALGEYIISETISQNVILPSGDVIVKPLKTAKVNNLRKQWDTLDQSVTFDEAYILGGNAPCAIYLVDTTIGDITVTIPPPTEKMARLNVTFENAEMKFINIGANDLIIANDGYANFIHKGVASTPIGGQLTVFAVTDYLTVTGDTT